MEEYRNRQRGHKRTQVTKLYNKVRSHALLSMTSNEKSIALSKLEKLNQEISDLNHEIDSSVKFDSDDDFDALMAECDSYEDKIIEAMTLINNSMPVPVTQGAGGAGSSDNSVHNNAQSNSFAKLKLPEVPLPYYSHAKDESLDQFLSSFDSIVNKYSITEYEKFCLLKSHLKGEPLVLINSLPVTQQSYDQAKQLLEEAFASDTTKKFDVMARLSSMKLEYNESPYEYIGEMRSLENIFQTLNIDNSDILQYFFWSGMTNGLQTQLINICNNNRPSLQEIKTNIFKAVERYVEVSTRIKEKKESKKSSNVNSFAVNLNSVTNRKIQYCSMCSSGPNNRESSHSTKDCTIYTTPETKINQLTKMGACTICGFGNHNTSNCRFKFKHKCIICGKDHMPYLCTETTAKVEPTNNNENDRRSKSNKNDKQILNSSVVCTSALKINVGNNVLLPTFVCNVKNRNIRCMKDSGSQPHFIKMSVANELELPVINDNFTVTVSGFNESQSYVTKTVQLELCIDDKVHKIEAICIPEIRTRLSLPGLTVLARFFLSRGYRLADSFLADGTDLITNLDFILGSSNPEILLEKQIKFGTNDISVFSETDAGILLYGNIHKIQSNLYSLPVVSNCNSVISNHCTFNIVSMCSENISNAFKILDSEISSKCDIDVNSSYIVVDSEGELNSRELLRATNDILNYDLDVYKENDTEVNTKVVNYILSNITRSDDGRIVAPLPWRGGVLNQLGTNCNLSLQILRSNLNKIRKTPHKLEMIHKVFTEQLESGIIDKVHNFDSYNDSGKRYSFLPHMSVFKLDRATTKCRVVFLSNLCEKNKNEIASYSHNQAMDAGPCLNQKITTALMHLRFGEKLLTYDLKKAFNQISLYKNDADKLLFHWFKDPLNGDFTPIVYRNVKLSFGLRASPCILMLSLYKILCVDIEGDDHDTIQFKKLLFSLLYMDNGSFTGTSDEVKWAYSKLNNVFNPYKFSLQQITSNEQFIQEDFDKSTGENTPEVVKLLGLQWNRTEDKLIAAPINLEINSTTKRQVLQTIAAQYDVFNFQGPLLNRARLFLHNLQCDTLLNWDSNLNQSLIEEWRRIVKQANASPPVLIDRFVGNREDVYELICFTDASKFIYASVVYIKNIITGKVSFLRGKHRLVNKQLSLKTIPSLELQALTLGVESLLEIKRELAGDDCIFPIIINNMRLYSDSMICLQWLNSYSHKLEKMQKQSIFVMNRLQYVVENCTSDNKITFSFVGTNSNTADCLSRAVSHKTMTKSRYIEGPEFLSSDRYDSLLDVTVPNPDIIIPDEMELHKIASFSSASVDRAHLVPLDRYSLFGKYVKVVTLVIKFIELLKHRVAVKHGNISKISEAQELKIKAVKTLLIEDQMINFPREYKFLMSPTNVIKDIPPLINRVNLFLDKDKLLKVKCKFARFSDNYEFPVLLSRNSKITEVIIRETHEELSHIGCYNLINHLRKRFFIDHIFSTVKRVIKKCTVCRRINGRTIKLNQSSYRDFRASPPCVPYKYIYVDYLGPFYIKSSNIKIKIWLLLFTCLWSRNVNIKVCKDMSVSTFLKSFQSHVFEEGMPSKVCSDLGSQITVAGNMIHDFLCNSEVQSYFSENNIDPVKFEHYFKGDSSLGSIVEVCVKFVKRLLFGSIGNNVLERDDFDFIICKTKYLLNSRPIAFKSVLSCNEELDIPEPITPELLNKGRNLTCVNVIPALGQSNDEDPDWSSKVASKDRITDQLSKLKRVQNKLVDLYNGEFMATLVNQAVDKDDRYKPVPHEKLSKGDIVLLREPLLKFHQYPMGIVQKVYENHQNEVTDVEILKGKTRELVQRHVTAVVPYLRSNECTGSDVKNVKSESRKVSKSQIKARRSAALKSEERTRALLANN